MRKPRTGTTTPPIAIPGASDHRGWDEDELFAERDLIRSKLVLFHQDEDGARDLTPAESTEFARLTVDLDDVQRLLDNRARMRDQMIRHPRSMVRISDALRVDGDAGASSDDNPYRAQALSRGLRAIEAHSILLDNAAGDRLEKLVRDADPRGLAARYLEAVGDRNYHSAFGKMLMDPTTGHLRFNEREVEAVRVVSQIQAERAVGIKDGASGGFAVPFTVDPTIMLSGAGAINPIRELARVFAVETDTWKGVSADTPVASYGAEGSEVGDASPTLAQPFITCQRGAAFIPYSIESGQDWNGLAAELARLLDDARAVLDSQKFLFGDPTADEPCGILNIGGTGSLTTSQRIQTTTAGTYGLADVYALKQALPARFSPNAAWTMHPNYLDKTYRFVPAGSTTEPQIMPDRGGPILGRPQREWSSMVTFTTGGSQIGIYGSFADAYFIADRIGSSLEILPLVLGTNHRPTGQRGAFFYWRSGAAIVNPNALRYLEVK